MKTWSESGSGPEFIICEVINLGPAVLSKHFSDSFLVSVVLFFGNTLSNAMKTIKHRSKIGRGPK